MRVDSYRQKQNGSAAKKDNSYRVSGVQELFDDTGCDSEIDATDDDL